MNGAWIAIVAVALWVGSAEAQVASCDGGCSCTTLGCTCNTGYCGSACTSGNSCRLAASPGTRASFLPSAGSTASCVSATCVIAAAGDTRVQCESATCQGSLQGGSLTCDEHSTCSFVVSGTTSVSCEDSATCAARCDGRCAFVCQSSAVCDYRCADGGAPTACSASRSVCGVLCDGGIPAVGIESGGGDFFVSRLAVGCSTASGWSGLAVVLMWWARRRSR
jgi:hypothetical protein